MGYIFTANPSLILSWLRSKGYTGTLNDALMRYFQGKATNKNGTLIDMISEALTNAGY